MHFLTGYAIITVQGMELERFLCCCVQRGALLRGIERASYTRMRASVSLVCLPAVRRAAEECGCALKLSLFGALPAFLRMRGRWLALCAVTLTAAAALILSGYVWRVEIKTSDGYPTAELAFALGELDVRPGIRKRDIDAASVERRLLLAFPELCYVDASLSGVTFTLTAEEGIAPPQLIEDSRPADIVAAKDGYITEVTAKEGRAVVGAGQTVKRGQTLISGVMGREDAPWTVSARGSVIAEVSYTAAACEPLFEESYAPTGRSTEVTYLRVGRRQWLMGEFPGYACYGERLLEKRSYFRNLFLPVRVLVAQVSELERTRAGKNRITLYEKLSREAFYKAAQLLPEGASVERVRYKSYEAEGKLYAVCIVVVNEEIGAVRYMKQDGE